GIAVDGSGNIFVVGSTTSNTNLPTANALQGSISGAQDGFAAKVTPGGALTYLTYLGGSGSESINAVALSPNNIAIVAGHTNSGDLPTTASAFQPTATGSNAFVASLDANGNTVDLTVSGSVDKDPIVVNPSHHDSFTLTFTVSVATGT